MEGENSGTLATLAKTQDTPLNRRKCNSGLSLMDSDFCSEQGSAVRRLGNHFRVVLHEGEAEPPGRHRILTTARCRRQG